jgi:antitoxin (DNA-binding transcriptional repressor) of toxin-antitoxin stability system
MPSTGRRGDVTLALDGDTWEVSIKGYMTDVTSKLLHEKTGQLLDRARQGERFRILRDGRAEAFLVPATEAVDPEWKEIMSEVWKAQKGPGSKRPNPILKERRARNYAARLR